MNNKRGITLIEVLVSIVILAVAVLAISYALQQTSLFSKQNNDKESNLSAARTVMEELKEALKSDSSITLYGQSVDLISLKAATPSPVQTLYLPTSAAPKVKIEIATLPLPEQATNVAIQGTTYNLNEDFRLVQVTATDVQTGQPYVLQAYLDSH
ncbi:type II secretion system protein [Gorillibacterium timonense]|uniref:type II secretion system protein n=1 Tax=Gorillibacterium timonense TaxID=1689269 RepID=UPI00071E40ED|nr:type II secretion system protein [Gorillibacterium timonense]